MQTNGNNSNNKSFIIRIEQIFRCSLKTTQLYMKINHYLQRNSKLCRYHLKRKKRRTIVGFTANKYKKCIYVHYQKQLYIKVTLTRGKYCRDIIIKNENFANLYCSLLLRRSLTKIRGSYSYVYLFYSLLFTSIWTMNLF